MLIRVYVRNAHAQRPWRLARPHVCSRAHICRLKGKEKFQHVEEDRLPDKRRDTAIDTDMKADGPKSKANKPEH